MPFTRDFDAIKNALNLVDECDKTCIEVGLMGAAQHVLEEWGNGTPCQVCNTLFLHLSRFFAIFAGVYFDGDIQ